MLHLLFMTWLIEEFFDYDISCLLVIWVFSGGKTNNAWLASKRERSRTIGVRRTGKSRLFITAGYENVSAGIFSGDSLIEIEQIFFAVHNLEWDPVYWLATADLVLVWLLHSKLDQLAIWSWYVSKNLSSKIPNYF